MGKQRQSNIELLRIVAMLMVMLIHIFPGAIGFSHQRMVDTPMSTVVSLAIEALSVVCVNVFVFISGWFGIHITTRKMLNLLFQVLFFSTLIFAVLAIWRPDYHLNALHAGTILFLNTDGYWFIKAYFGLAILSPVINAFTENADRKTFLWVLMAFYILQTVYGWMVIDGASWFAGGYSAMSFVGLYLLAQYLRRHGEPLVSWKGSRWGWVYFGIAALQTIMASVLTYVNIPIAGRLFTYTNPLVIVQSVALFLWFRSFSFQSKWVNSIAVSCLAVYLLHANPLVLQTYYGLTVFNWFNTEPSGLFVIYTTLFISAYFVAAILLDKLRMALFSMVAQRFSRKDEREISNV